MSKFLMVLFKGFLDVVVLDLVIPVWRAELLELSEFSQLLTFENMTTWRTTRHTRTNTALILLQLIYSNGNGSTENCSTVIPNMPATCNMANETHSNWINRTPSGSAYMCVAALRPNRDRMKLDCDRHGPLNAAGNQAVFFFCEVVGRGHSAHSPVPFNSLSSFNWTHSVDKKSIQMPLFHHYESY